MERTRNLTGPLRKRIERLGARPVAQPRAVVACFVLEAKPEGVVVAVTDPRLWCLKGLWYGDLVPEVQRV